jgi:hypothetical protein
MYDIPLKPAMKELFSNYPKKIKASMQHAENCYVLQKGLYAVHGTMPLPCKAATMVTIEEGKLVICKGNPDELPPSVDRNTITPVYALESSGPLVVPTGLILVRFAQNITAVSQKEALQRIGYIIDQELAYASHALWVKSANGDVAFALNNVPLLEAQPHVANVEPQMLMQSVRRSPSSRPL